MLRPSTPPRGAPRPSEIPSGSCLARWEPSCDRSRPPPQSGSTRRGTLLQPPCGNATTTTVSSETIANCIALDAISSRTRIGGPRQERTRVVDKEKDWEKEMAEVDRLLKKLPYGEPTPSASSAPTVRKTPAVAPPGADPTAAGQWLGTWARVVLGLLIGIGMTQWPYTHGCGLRLIFYLIGVAAVIAAGTWSAISSWKRRFGVAHVLAQGLIIFGLVLAAREVLPRIGYAKAEAPWLCRDVVPPSSH